VTGEGAGLAGLAGIVGAEHVLTSPDLTASYTTDWTRRYGGPALCVVRPADTGEVARVLGWCAERRVPVVPQGGNTSLVGGSVPPAGPAQHQPPAASVPPAAGRGPDPPAAGPVPPAARAGERGAGACLVLSLTRLDRLGPVDTLSAQVTAGAGVTLAALRAHAAAAGLEYGVDLAARDSATVGGTIATNAGGVHTIRFGPTRQQVLGVEAVSSGGAVMNHLSGLAMDNTGYHLPGLITGSEGTLAVLTAARLRLWPAEPVAAVVLTGVAGIGEAASLQAAVRARVRGLRALEYIEAAGLDLVLAATGLPPPLRRAYPGYLLAEVTGTEQDAQQLAEAGLPDDAAVALDGPGQQRLWAYRERATEAISSAGVPHKLDVAVPLARIAEFRGRLDEVVRAAAGPDCQVIVFGHLGAGNLHVNLLGPGPADEAADEAVLRLAAGLGGTISAEHGVGRAKARWLPLSRSAAEIDAMRAIKRALDPAGLLNPGVLFGDSAPRGQRCALRHSS
jgi:FAD/FMN-containing dehydrogenase